MPKFRTMIENSPDVATHLLDNPEIYITKIGRYLRKTSLDETPQIFSIIKGDMSLVGPRPALFNQDDLIKLRTKSNIHKLSPGLTGLAQINGRDELSIREKIDFDEIYLKKQSILFDLRILILTILKIILRDKVSH